MVLTGTFFRRAQRRSLVIKNLNRHISRGDWERGFYCVCPARNPKLLTQLWRLKAHALCRKIWDTNSGEALHTFQHKHIVRSVALNPQQQPQYLLTVSSQ